MAGNPWINHLRAYWAKNKSKGISYKQAMKNARASYKPKATQHARHIA